LKGASLASVTRTVGPRFVLCAIAVQVLASRAQFSSQSLQREVFWLLVFAKASNSSITGVLWNVEAKSKLKIQASAQNVTVRTAPQRQHHPQDGQASTPRTSSQAPQLQRKKGLKG
jgi:hypothetical protein